MILSFVLTCLFAFLGYCTLILCRHGWLRNILLALYVSGIVLAWFPDASTFLARLFGIGRGLDLVLVLFSMVLFLCTFFILVQLHTQHRKLTLMARHIAIREAVAPFASQNQKPETQVADNENSR